MTVDPWAQLKLPDRPEELSAVPVSTIARFQFYWAVDRGRRTFLVLRHSLDSPLEPPAPQLRGLSVSYEPAQAGSAGRVILGLLSLEYREPFLVLCNDVMHACDTADSEEAAVAIVVQRLWRWHRLLRGGAANRLSKAEQVGLWGELTVLRLHVSNRLEVRAALASWRGPLGERQDFQFSGASLEVKTVSDYTPSLVVHSEWQFVPATYGQPLYLAVCRVAVGASVGVGSSSLDELVATMRVDLNAIPSALARFDNLLFAAGYSRDAGYPEIIALSEPPSLFHVGPDFPSITPATLPPGIKDVQYAIDAQALRRHGTEWTTLYELLA